MHDPKRKLALGTGSAPGGFWRKHGVFLHHVANRVSIGDVTTLHGWESFAAMASAFYWALTTFESRRLIHLI
jgi:hypothetical protein